LRSPFRRGCSQIGREREIALTVEFKNPPIHELVIGARFDPPLEALRSEHIGLLWREMQEDFPTVEQHHPPGGSAMNAGEFFPMPRFWLVSGERDNLIQVQKDAFLLNWRKGVSSYPRFSRQKPAFDRYFDIFADFVREHVKEPELKIAQCELTYLDVIRPCDYWNGPADTRKLIPSFVVPGCSVENGDADAFNCSYVFNVSPNLRLQVAIRTAGQDGESDVPLLALELSARGHVGGVPKSETNEWYEKAHDMIYDFFMRITDEEIRQKHWIIEEAPAWLRMLRQERICGALRLMRLVLPVPNRPTSHLAQTYTFGSLLGELSLQTQLAPWLRVAFCLRRSHPAWRSRK